MTNPIIETDLAQILNTMIYQEIKANKTLFRGKLSSNQTVKLKGNIKSITVLDKDNVKSFAGKVGWGFIGTYAGAMINPVGAIAGLGAGLLSGGNKSQLTIAVELSNETKFLAIVDTKLYRELEGLTCISEQSSLVKQSNLFGSFNSEEYQAKAIARNKAQVQWFKKRSPLEQKIIIGGVVTFFLMFFGWLIQENQKIQQERYSSGIS
ncbi:MAG: hypothetical protein ACRC80_35955, partial [Waterburya sp.]